MSACATSIADACECCSRRRPAFELTLGGLTFRLCQTCILPEDIADAEPLSEWVDQPLDFGPAWICSTAINAAATAFEVTAEQVIAAGRVRKVADARIVAMAAARAAGATPLAIAGAFDRDHSTVAKALQRAKHDDRLDEAVQAVARSAFAGRRVAI